MRGTDEQETAIPSTQRALLQHGYGPVDDVLRWVNDHPVVRPGRRQVQVGVRAASVNPIDWQMIQGHRRLISRRLLPFVPFFDLAGVVTAIGPDVQHFSVGDVVHADN